MKRTVSILFIVAVLALASLSCRTLLGGAPNNQAPFSQPPAAVTAVIVAPNPNPNPGIPPAVDLTASQDLLTNLYQKVNPGVVEIDVLTQDGKGLGSGFVIDTDGHIVTNYHVVEGETELEVTFSSGFKVRGKVIGTDLDSDLAVVKVDAPATELQPLPLGDSDQVRVGQTVIAIGNPFGYQGTMTTGIISGLGRTIGSLHITQEGNTFNAADIIQTDAAINPGNSGGPLLNLNGEVVGVNESIVTSGGERVNSGVGFAVPINIVKRVVPALIANGKYDYPYLGISSLPDELFTLEVAEALGISQTTGVYILSVVNGGPAEKAGIQGGNKETSITGLLSGGDLITAIDGQPVRNYNDLISYLVKNKAPGDNVVLTVIRDGQTKDFTLVLDKRPE